MLVEDCHKEATLVIILRVEPHTPGQVEGITQMSPIFLIVPVSVVLVEHSLGKGMRLTFFTFPIGDRWPSLIPESRMVLAFATMEDFPFEQAGSVAEVWANFFRDIDECDIVFHFAQGCLDDSFVFDWIERAC